MRTPSQSLVPLEPSSHNWDKLNGCVGWGGGWKVFTPPGRKCRKVIQVLEGSGMVNYGNLSREEDIKELKEGMIDSSQWRQVYDDRLVIQKLKG